VNLNESGSQTPRGTRGSAKRLARWFRRRRHMMALNALRGASYAVGTSVVGLIAWWVESRY
jgi:hypothetical protein